MTYANTKTSGIFGRDGEIDTLRASYDRVSKTGFGEIVLVAGPAGSGKTSVVNAFLASSHSMKLVHAKADEAYRWMPYATIIKALSVFLPKDTIDAIMVAQDDSAPISPTQVRERLIQAIRSHTSPSAPLVVFIDDLQWLDESSIQLLQSLSERGMRDLLLIGTYRSNGKAEFEKRGLPTLVSNPSVRITDIVLESLPYDAVEGLISSQRFGDTTKPLARLVQSVAGGNPFHIQLILNVLEQADAAPDLAYFVSDQKNWGLDALLGKLVGNLPADTRKLLQFASCIGFSSDVSVLASLVDLAPEQCPTILQTASSLGLIRFDESTCHFTHDSVREHVRKSLTKACRTRTHGLVAVALLDSDIRTADQRLAVAEQLIKAKRSPVLYDHLERACDALIRATTIARSMGSFEGALRYVEGGIDLLSLSPALEVYRRRLAELRCAVLLDIHGAAIDDAEIERLLIESHTPLDAARAIRLQSGVLILRGRFEEAISASLAGLSGLGITLSRVPTQAEIGTAYESTLDALKTFSLDNLLEQPRADDVNIVVALDLLASLQSSFFSDDGLKFIHTAKIVELSARHGITGSTCYGLSWFGVCVASYYSDYESALAMAEAGVRLSSLEAFRPHRTSSLVALDQVSVWSKPLSFALSKAKEAFEHGRNSGDISMACYATNHVVSNLLAMGAPLSVVKNEATRGLALARSVGFDEVIQILQLQDSFADLLKSGDGTNANLFEIATFNKASQMSPLMFWGHLYEGIAAFYRGDLNHATQSLMQAEPWLWTTPAHIHIADLHFYAAMSERLNGRTPKDDVHREAIARFARHNPFTFQNKLSLIDAEAARIEGRTIDALRLYEKSIIGAKETGFSHELALAHERAGRMSLEVGLMFAGVEHFRRAQIQYRKWGADYLAERLIAEYPEIVARQMRDGELDPVVPRSEKFDALTTDLVIAAIKYSGAMRGQLINVEQGQMSVIAHSSISNGIAKVAVENSEYNSTTAPTSMIRLVLESAQSLRYGHAIAEAGELHGQSLVECPAMSVLCVPLIQNDRVFSILYLENNAVCDAFSYETEQAIELFVVATTEAIRLKRQIDAEVQSKLEHEARENAFVNVRADMIKNSHVTVLGGMAASIVHEVNQPLSAIVTHAFSGSRWLKQAVPQIEKALNNFTKIQESGVRASGIISALRSLVKQAPANLEFLDMRDVVAEVLGFIEMDARTGDVEIECHLPEAGSVFADPIQVQQVVLNLMTNALDAMDGLGTKLLKVELMSRDDTVVLAVADSGTGIPPHVRGSIFEPFFTTKDKGLGMGLAICKTIAEVHGGDLTIGASNSEGTTMVLTLPMTEQ